ncbi:MAG: chromosome condensation regulator [Harvfovirus sp.]|uniref:Chromosome condensation regulator n=1 Tax=Harvfovirus sp. TaxID=2487768 RepID=A0A3G5A1Y5_9VIRU|nr:MAG: chromosome condensation regulator [Harvfovirus sp.]
MNDLFLLRSLPLDLLYIVANYDHQVIFIFSEKDLLQLNWIRLLKINFFKDYKNSLFAKEELMRIYIYNSFWKTNQIACGQYASTVINENDDNTVKVISDSPSEMKEFEKNISQIAYGGEHVIVLLLDGTLLCRGQNSCGQLGFGDYIPRNTFVKNDTLPADISIKQIACGYVHTLILLTNGTLLTAGMNTNGQLGTETITESTNSFRKLDNVKNIVQIACGYYHSFIKLKDGTILGCGRNESGQLGLGKIKRVTSFQKIKCVPKNIVDISCGSGCTFLLIDDGTLMSCGFNGSGALGLGDNVNRNTFTHIQNLPANVVKIQVGYDHAICLLADGSIMSCGYNYRSGLGFQDTISRNIFEKIKDLPEKVKNIGTSCFALYSVICLFNDTMIKFDRDFKTYNLV